MSVPTRALAVTLAAITFQTAAPAAVEVLTPHFRVVSVLEPGSAEAAADHLEAIRHRFESLGFALHRPPSPRIDVILFATPAEMLPHAPPYAQDDGNTAGFFTPGGDRMYMVVAWDAPGGPWIALSHEYVHRIFANQALPFWLSEGLAEYLSRLSIAARSRAGGPAEPPRPVSHFAERLADNPWVPWSEIWSAQRDSAAARHPNFRPQSWLLVHLLASEGLDLTQLDPAKVQATLAKQSAESIEARLKAAFGKSLSNRYLSPHQESRPSEPFAISPRRFDPGGAGSATQPRKLAAGELRFVLADLQRQTQPAEAVRPELEALKQEFPNRPEPSESLGALEMDLHHYDQAERHLADAVEKGSRNPRTHYRYSLMLMRPDSSPERAGLAVKHAELARQFDSSQPLYLLNAAQAHMTAENWEESAAALAHLAQHPDWESRAQIEFTELQRRQQQQLNRLQREVLTVSSDKAASVHSGLLAPFTLKPVPKPLPEAEPSRPSWPPPGTILLYGHIRNVECRENEKIVTVMTRRNRIRLREPADAPAKLYSKPKRIKGLECGLGGLEVNVAYKPTRRSGEVRGTLVAVVF